MIQRSAGYLFFLGGDFGFPASLRFFLHVPSSLRARGSLPTYGPCLDPALRSAISRSSYPFLDLLSSGSLKPSACHSKSCGQEQAVFLTCPTVRVRAADVFASGLSHNRYRTTVNRSFDHDQLVDTSPALEGLDICWSQLKPLASHPLCAEPPVPVCLYTTWIIGLNLVDQLLFNGRCGT